MVDSLSWRKRLIRGVFICLNTFQEFDETRFIYYGAVNWGEVVIIENITMNQ